MNLLGNIVTINNNYLVFDYCNGGTLQNFIARSKFIDPEEAFKIFKQICSGYSAIRQMKVIHRNLTSSSIHFYNGKIKIGHFKFSRIMEGNLDEPQ